MIKYFYLVTIVFSLNVWAGPGREAWIKGNAKQRLEILKEYREFFAQHNKLKEQLEVVKFRLNLSLFSEAWAAEEMNCIYAGWPSQRVGGFCSSPSRMNPQYQKNNCSDNQLQCQPLLFGEGLCVSTATKEQRSLAFSNCERKFVSEGRKVENVIAEAKSKNKEQELLKLLDFADKICSEGMQKSTGMCRRLEAAVQKVRAGIPASSDVVVDGATVIDEGVKLDVIDAAVTPEAIAVEVGQAGRGPTDCEPKATTVVRTVATVSSTQPAAKVREPGSVYTPQQALADINSGKLEFMGRELMPGSGQNRTCIYKSERAYILYGNCMANKKESHALDIEVIAFDGGKFSFYNESYNESKPNSQAQRAEYDGTWTISYTPTPKPGNLNIKGIMDYMVAAQNSPDGACYIGKSAGAQDMTSKSSCFGKQASNLSSWGPAAESFWYRPDASWYETQLKLRRLVVATKF